MDCISEFRKECKSRVGCVEPDLELASKLNGLVVLNEDNTTSVTSAFYERLSNVINWNRINNLPYKKDFQTSDDFTDCLKLLSWANNSWHINIETGDLNKLVISYILYSRLDMEPDEELTWDLTGHDALRKKLEELLPKLQFNIVRHPDISQSYSDKKFFDDYAISMENNDFKGIFVFLGALDRGRALADDLIEVTTKLSCAVDPYLLASNIEKYNPVHLKEVFGNLNRNQIISVAELYCGEKVLPLLVALLQIINPAGNNKLDNSDLEDFDFIEKVAKIVEQISERIEVENLFSFITGCSNIFMNPLWHAIYSAFVALNFNFHKSYSGNIRFEYDVGFASFQAFTRFCEDEKQLEQFSIDIYNAFIHYVQNNRNQYVFCYTSYSNFILYAVYCLHEKSAGKYFSHLELLSTGLNRAINSWDHSKINGLLTEWNFWIFGSKKLEKSKQLDLNLLPETARLLKDNRVIKLLNGNSDDESRNFNQLSSLLEDPASITSLDIPYNNSIVTIQFS